MTHSDGIQIPRQWRATLRIALVAALATVCWLGSAVAQAQGSTHRLRIVGGLAGINQYVQHEAPFWTQTLAQLSSGRFSAEIVPFDRAGVPAQDMLRLMQLGVIPFGTAQISRVVAQDAEFGAMDLAGLNPDLATLKKTVAAFRPYLETTLRQRFNIELLAVYIYPAQMVFCKQPMTSLHDLAGRRVRVTGATAADFLQAFGAIPVASNLSDMVSKLKQGNFACAVTGSMSGNTVGLHEVTTHIYTMPITWGVSLFGANQDDWNALDPALRALLRQEMPKLEARIWEASERETAEGIACNGGAELCRNGRKGHMVVVPATAHDERRRKEVLESDILPKWLARCGLNCVQIWNRTIGPVHNMTAQGSP